MTHPPITPPPELLQQWATEYWGNSGESIGQGEKYIATQAARWGADQELEACCEWIRTNLKGQLRPSNWIADNLRVAMRPKPPSLAEKGLSLIDQSAHLTPEGRVTIRRALERLQHLEQESNDN